MPQKRKKKSVSHRAKWQRRNSSTCVKYFELTKECNRHDPGPNNRTREPEFRLRSTPLSLAAPHEPSITCPPNRVTRNSHEHADKQPHEGQSRLREREAVIVLEYKRERAEEKVENAEQDGAQNAEAEALLRKSET